MKPVPWRSWLPYGAHRVKLEGRHYWTERGRRRRGPLDAVRWEEVTCTRWRPSILERLAILFGGSVYVRTLGPPYPGGTEPPVLHVTTSPQEDW